MVTGDLKLKWLLIKEYFQCFCAVFILLLQHCCLLFFYADSPTISSHCCSSCARLSEWCVLASGRWLQPDHSTTMLQIGEWLRKTTRWLLCWVKWFIYIFSNLVWRWRGCAAICSIILTGWCRATWPLNPNYNVIFVFIASSNRQELFNLRSYRQEQVITHSEMAVSEHLAGCERQHLTRPGFGWWTAGHQFL